MDQRHKDFSSAIPSFKMLPRSDSKSNSVGELSTLLSREQKLQKDVRRHSSHGICSDGKALIARGSRALSLQSSCHYGSAPSIPSKQFLYESRSEGSLRRKELVSNISLNEAATIPFGLLYELAEHLNPLGHDTLNQLAILIGMTQEQFNKLYKSAINPAVSLLTEAERFLESLGDLKVALEILQQIEAVNLIQKHQLESSRKATITKFSPRTSTQTLPTDSDTDSDDQDLKTPVFTVGDRRAESVNGSKSDRVEGTDYMVMQGDGEGREGSKLHMPSVALGCRVPFQQSFLQHKESKPIKYKPQSSCSKTPPKEMLSSPTSSLCSEVLQTMRSEGSQVDSGFASAERSALSSGSFTLSTDDTLCISDYIDEAGGVLYIPNTNISLLVPEGALKRSKMIKLKVTTNPTVKGCPQSANHPRLTPLISCEPDGLKFLKAAELTIPHCGIIQDPKEAVEVYVRSGVQGEDMKWKRDDYASRNAVLNINTCSIPITHFCDFDVFVRDEGNIIGKKMRTFPMANCLEQSSDDILLSLWMCNDYDQEYNVIVKEKQDLVTNVLLDQYNCYMLEPSRKSVNVDYRNLSEMWTLENHQQEIGYHQLWYGSKAKATFRMKCNTSAGGGKLNGTLAVKQKEHCESTKFELQHQVRDLLKQQIMQTEEPHQLGSPSFQAQRSYTTQCSVVYADQSSLLEQSACHRTSMHVTVKKEDEIYIPPTTPNENHLHIHMPSSYSEHSNVMSPQSPPTFQVPYDLAIQLGFHLNGEDALDNDWRLLASDIGYNPMEISTFKRRENPTYDMLQDACKKGRLENFDQLRTILKNRERIDAVKILDNYLKRKDADPRRMAIEGPQNEMKPELSRQSSGKFSISTEEQLTVAPSDQLQHNHQMMLPRPQDRLCERETCSLPFSTSTPLRLSSTTQHGETVHESMKYIKGHGNDSGVDSPVSSRLQSRRSRNIILAPRFGESIKCNVESEPNDSGAVFSLISESSLTDTQSSHKGIASQSSSDDSGLAESPSSEKLGSSPPLDKLNQVFRSES